MQKSKIEWTDYTWNPVWGCHGGCDYCYARGIAKRFAKPMAEYEEKFNRGNEPETYASVIKTKLENFEPVILWSQYYKNFPKKASKIFVGSMTDIAFWEERTIVHLLLPRIEKHPQHTFQILTKFPEKLIEMGIEFPDNVWLGITAENQTTADSRIPDLLKIKAGKRFVSIEPMQGEVDLTMIKGFNSKGEILCYYQVLQEITGCGDSNRAKLDWVIIGGQTGPAAKPMQIEWVKSVIKQCKQHGTPLFFKSWGKHTPPSGELVCEAHQQFPV